MRTLLITLSFIGLCLTLVPSVLVVMGDVSVQQNKNLMIIGMVLWYGTVTFWMDRKKKA